ncbi:MAG: Holliday junction branch migration protein RuvA [Parcubacteria group bacterium]|nr:Holliday junction branch migration protein RuvA [Parcubacteria group bacterium]
MISHLTGDIIFSGNRFVILGVGGVGYKIFTAMTAIRADLKKARVSFWTHLAVRENALDLYGFLTRAELEFFELLITVSGIGPKTALGIMEIAPTDTLKKAIASGDSSYLTDVSGIGKKNAHKIILELQNKLGGDGGIQDDNLRKEDIETLEALETLGYSIREARETLKRVNEKHSDGTAQEKIKAALKMLGK